MIAQLYLKMAAGYDYRWAYQFEYGTQNLKQE